MRLFKKNKAGVIIFIVIVGLFIMWGKSIIAEKGEGILSVFSKEYAEEILRKIVARGRSIIAKEEVGVSPTGAVLEKEPAKEAAEEIVPVKVTKVARMDFKDTIPSFGTIKGFGEIPIRFKDSGTISKFYFKEGDKIKKGDIVVSQEKEQEELKLEYAKIEYDKNRMLYELGAITRDKLRQTELGVESAELELKKRNFYAPTDGLMGTRKANEGEIVKLDDIIATFLDISYVYCEIGIIERDIGKVKNGQEAIVTFDTFPGDIFYGVVDSVSPMVEGRSRTQNVRILIPNEKRLIKPGMFARAEINIFEKKFALVVPRKSLKKTDEGYLVFGVIRDEQKTEKSPAGFEIATAKVIPVKIERATEKLALIERGLIEGQEIILESPEAKESIEDGTKIEIIGSEQNL